MNLENLQGNGKRINVNPGKITALQMEQTLRLPSLDGPSADLRSLLPGQSFSGQITDIQNGYVTVDSKGQTFHAKFEASMDLCIGEVMSFVVRENDGEHIFIAPNGKENLPVLDAALYKALAAAGLPATDKNIDVVSELLKNQMSLDKKSIQQMLSFAFQFPEASVEDIALLVKYKMPVSWENLEQLAQYKKGEAPLTEDIKLFIEKLPDTVLQLADKQGLDKALDFLRALEIFPEKSGRKEEAAWKEALQSVKTPEELKQFMENDAFQKELAGELEKQWTLEPKEVSRDNLNRLYEKLEKHMRAAGEKLEELPGQKEGEDDRYAAKAVPERAAAAGRAAQPGPEIAQSARNLQNNLEFMKDLNQQFIYAQLPLHLKEQITHGELYVFANKKGIRSEKDGLRILLHLDMEHLGGTDILIHLTGRLVKLTFTLEEEASLALLREGFGEVEKKLVEKGFRVTGEFEKKSTDFQFAEDFMEQNAVPKSNVKKYSFDMRA